jgi:thioredoxin reductase (NADPH)
MQNPSQYAGKRVMIVGGGDSAVDWANHLAPISAKVYVVHRRDAFRAHEESVDKMRAQVDLKVPFQVKDLEGESKVERAIITQGPKGPEETLEIDAVLAFLGFVTSPGPIANWGIVLRDDEILINQRTETNLPGVYAAGDCATYDGKVKLISVGFGEAAIAVNHAVVFMDPKKRVFPGHSSNLK